MKNKKEFLFFFFKKKNFLIILIRYLIKIYTGDEHFLDKIEYSLKLSLLSSIFLILI